MIALRPWLPALVGAAGALLLVAALAVTLRGPGAVSAVVPVGAIQFTETTDTIQVGGQTTLGTNSTYEARIFFPSGASGGGMVFNEQTDFAEDKYFEVGTTFLWGFNHPNQPILQASVAISEDAWHHIALCRKALPANRDCTSMER